MFIRIRHETTYRYDRPVFLEPTMIRLMPRENGGQRLLDYRIEIEPQPGGSSLTLEQDGANAHAVWFSGMHEQLSIVTTSLVETRRVNPFDYLLTHEPARRVPGRYPALLTPVLAPFLAGEQPRSIRDWAAALVSEAKGMTTDFLQCLTQRIYETFEVFERREGDPFAPDRTLAEQGGACRDLAMLFIAACRSQGIAARFVSGYSTHHPPDTARHELHAWAEVYLPGGGWRGYDPTLGLAVADGHVALATGPDHELAAPVTGSFRGTEASYTLTYAIDLQAADHLEA